MKSFFFGSKAFVIQISMIEKKRKGDAVENPLVILSFQHQPFQLFTIVKQ